MKRANLIVGYVLLLMMVHPARGGDFEYFERLDAEPASVLDVGMALIDVHYQGQLARLTDAVVPLGVSRMSCETWFQPLGPLIVVNYVVKFVDGTPVEVQKNAVRMLNLMLNQEGEAEAIRKMFIHRSLRPIAWHEIDRIVEFVVFNIRREGAGGDSSDVFGSWRYGAAEIDFEGQ